ncbi:MAG TPA: universal stress protein [Candidatus Limnocylindria bacterium]|nr:universal stress protein [Candidatus Limnocylindria bacterium]
MKVLFATDGSPADRSARQFVAGARWPAGSEIELFGVVAPNPLAVSGVLVERDLRAFEHELDFLAASLPGRDCVITWRDAVGQPAEMIALRARAMEADLIVVGNRGRGPIAAAVLGSVSSGVIDRAPCPVLVARRSAARRIVLADDGSSGAAAAAAFVNDWPLFDDAALEIVTVVDVGRPLSASDGAPALYSAGELLYLESLDEERARARATVAARLRMLKPRPRAVKTSVRERDAADEVLAAAHEFAADLIVVGSRGQTGLARFFAGSVARRVLMRASCSVLIARGSARLVREHDPAMMPFGLLTPT